MTIALTAPFPLFADLDGTPLDSGYVYLGVAGSNPEVSPITVYWDAATTQPTAQPLRTSGGQIVRDGLPSVVYTNAADYSLTVRSKSRQLVAYLPSAAAANNGLVIGTLRSDLANTTDAAKGARLVGFAATNAYAAGTVGFKLNQIVSLADKSGVTFDPSVDSLSAINALIASTPSSEVYIPAGDVGVSNEITNPYGKKFVGPGHVLLKTTGAQAGYPQITTQSYGDDLQLHIGKEYLYRVRQRLRTVTGQITCYIYGDSTVAGGNGESAGFRAEAYLYSAAQTKGLFMPFYCVNRGVSGTKITDLNAIPDLAAGTDLFIIKYGINDGGNDWSTRLATFATNLRAKLAAIRGSTYGDIAQLSIVLMGPNVTYDPPSGRDPRWYEQLRNVYVQAARDYRCAYFDTYAYLRDCRNAAGLWMDNPFGDGLRPIHPLDDMNALIWGGLLDWMHPQGESQSYRANGFINIGSAHGYALPTDLPSSFIYGWTAKRARGSDGWPEDGAVLTMKSRDGPAFQMLFPYAPGRTVRLTRLSDSASNLWNLWAGQVVQPALLNGWVEYGGSFAARKCVLGDDGTVTVQAVIKSGTTTAGTALFVLPAGMRPSGNTPPVICATNAGNCAVNVATDGTVSLNTAGDATYTALCFTFRAA